MLYHVTRNGQNYGPYTLEDLQRYVASGNVLPTDLAKSEEMPEWAPVAQVLGMQAPPTAIAGSYQPPPPADYAMQSTAAYPDAPDLPWGLVLLFGLLTCTLFMFVWNIVVSAWMKRVQPNSKAVIFYALAAALLIVQAVSGAQMQMQIHPQVGNVWAVYQAHPLRNMVGLAVWVVRLVARFMMRASLEEHFNGPEPIGLRLSGVMTFFFGGVYFQYHLNRINEYKRMARYRGAAI